MLLYFHSLNPNLPSSHDTFLHCHMLEFMFQFYLSQCYVVSAHYQFQCAYISLCPNLGDTGRQLWQNTISVGFQYNAHQRHKF